MIIMVILASAHNSRLDFPGLRTLRLLQITDLHYALSISGNKILICPSTVTIIYCLLTSIEQSLSGFLRGSLSHRSRVPLQAVVVSEVSNQITSLHSPTDYVDTTCSPVFRCFADALLGYFELFSTVVDTTPRVPTSRMAEAIQYHSHST